MELTDRQLRHRLKQGELILIRVGQHLFRSWRVSVRIDKDLEAATEHVWKLKRIVRKEKHELRSKSTSVRFTDRSRQIEYQRCPRARFLEYEWGGTGVRKVRATIPLATGQFVHVGLANVLEQIVAMGEKPHAHLSVNVDQASMAATEGYRREVARRGLDVELGEDGQYVADEQIALTEALVRGYVKAPKGLEALLSQYRVLEVEREERWDGFAQAANGDEIVMQARLDGLLQERSTGDLYVLSFKTASGYDYRKEEEGRHDVQGLSEAAAVERRLRRDWAAAQDKVEGLEIARARLGASYCDFLLSLPSEPRIMGIQMVYLVKGRRDKPSDESTTYRTMSHLIRGWTREGVTEPELAWRFKWSGPDVWPDSGKPRGHTLGRGWTLFDVWNQPGGVAAWIDLLASGTVQPDCGDPFDSVVWQPLPYFRQDRDLSDWLEQTQHQESQVASCVTALDAVRNAPEDLRHELNVLFPQHRRSCDWPSRCQFVEICFGDDSMLTNPCGTGIYQIREPHHALEMEARREHDRAQTNADAVERALAEEG